MWWVRHNIYNQKKTLATIKLNFLNTMENILSKIDQYICKRGGILYRFWFVYEQVDEETGYIKRRFFKEKNI